MRFEKETIGDALDLIVNGVNCKQNKKGIGEKITRIETIAFKKINYEKTGFSKLTEADKKRYRLIKNDILFSHINSPIHVGKTAIYNDEEPIYHGVNLLRLRVKKHIDAKFFNYFLNSLFLSGYWTRNSKQAVNQASVNQTDIKTIPFSYPLLSEQQRIVEKLEKVFVEIDNMIADTERNIKNSQVLNQNFLEKWLKENTSINDYCTVQDCIDNGILKSPFDGNHGEIHPKASDYTTDGTPFIMAKNIINGSVNLLDCKFIPTILANSLRVGFAKNNDVLLTHKGTIGEVAILDTLHKFIMLTPQVTSYRIINTLKLDKNYLYFLFKSSYFQKQLQEIAAIGSTRAYIGITRQKKLKLCIPDISLQLEAITKLQTAENETNKLTQLYIKRLNNLAKLRSALLAVAITKKVA